MIRMVSMRVAMSNLSIVARPKLLGLIVLPVFCGAFFMLPNADDNLVAECTLCHATVRRGTKKANASNGGMWSYLKTRHKEEHEKVLGAKEDEKKRKDEFKENELAADAMFPATKKARLQSTSSEPKSLVQSTLTLTSSLSSTKPKANIERVQTLCQPFVTVNSKWAHSDPKAIEMTNDLAIVIALDQEPYAMVEHYGFGGFLEKRFPWYQIPTADHMARVAIPQLYQSVAEPVRQILSASKTVAIATDGWTAENAAFEILGLIVFTIQDDGKLNRVVLCCPEIRGSANAENMKIVIKQALEDWQLTDWVVAFVTDNAPVMQKAVRLLEYPRHGCVVHRLQNAVRKNIPSTPSDGEPVQRIVNDVVACCKQIAGHLNRISKAANDSWNESCLESGAASTK
ncbi:hypothetical protein BOX15_Mlig005715g1 [Macrostomum lignano]|uniref:DUF659 domain-containing protein n=1 Tax=Macrostomum lignano TaxID=282301 RepID=A0A267FLR9_9PLAT|nr:hypothetical protein BOX15_Mlig005715g1 [Macrostomum lignano]